jgi:hypothetical protein
MTTGARRTITLSTLVGLLVVFLGVLLGVSPLRDNSFLTHLATGRLILEDGIPNADPYSFTAAGTTWVVQSWLPAAVYASLEGLGGLAAIRVLVGLASGVLAAMVWLLTAPARGTLVRLGLAGLTVLIGIAAWSERPLLFGLVALGLVLVSAEGRVDPRWLVPVMWLWVNSHGSFPLGLLAVGLLWAGTRLDGGDGRRELRVLAWAAGGTLLGAVGPLGPKVLLFPAELLSRRDVLSQVREWQAPTFQSPDEMAFLVLVVVAIVALVRRPTWRAALPLVVFVALSALAARNQAPASLVLVPGAAAGLAGLGSLTGERRSPVLTAGAALLAVVTLFVLATPLLQGDSPEGDAVAAELTGGPQLGLYGYPVAAVSWLDQQGHLDGEQRVVARELVGNYLEGLYGTDVPVFVDDRFDMYPTEVLEDHFALLEGGSTERGGSLELLSSYEPELVLWETNSALGQLLTASDRWAVVYQDEEWLIACPREAPGAPARCGG